MHGQRWSLRQLLLEELLPLARRELQALGFDEGHWLAILALNLARHIDHADGEPVAGLIAMIREHDACLSDIRARCARSAALPHTP